MTDNWTGATATGNWSDGTKWSTGNPPVTNDDVTIDTGATTETITYDAGAGSVTIKTLQLGVHDTLAINASGQTLTVTDSSTTGFVNNGAVAVPAGHLTVNGRMSGNGTVGLSAGATFTFNDAGSANTDRVVISGSAGTVSLTGGNNSNFYLFGISDLHSTDTVTGGTGGDVLVFTTAGAMNANAFAHVTGVENIDLAAGGNSIVLTNAMVGSAANVTLTVSGGAGNDTIDASAIANPNRVHLNGGNGADTFIFGNNLNQLQTVVGGDDNSTDTLVFNTALATSPSFAGVSGIEAITLAAGTNTLTLTNALVHSALTVNGNTGADTIDASAVGTFKIVTFVGGGGGNDTYIGGAENDFLQFTPAELNSGDHLTGGGGEDALTIYGSGTVGAAALVNVHGITDFYLSSSGTNLTLSASQGSGTKIFGNNTNDTVDASQASGGVTFNTAGGNDVLTGSAFADTFNLAFSGNDTVSAGDGDDLVQVNVLDFNNADTISGGAGFDKLAILSNGPETVSANAFANVSGIEGLELSSNSSGGISVTLNDALVTSAGGTLFVYGNYGADTVDGSAVAIGHSIDFVFTDQAHGNNTLIGGAGDDIFQFRDKNFVNEHLTGGTGTDTLAFDGTIDVSAADLANVTGIDVITMDRGDHHLQLSDAVISATATGRLTVISTDKSKNDFIDAGAVTGSGNRVLFDTGTGTDTLVGSAGNDTFKFAVSALDSTDFVAGDAGNDRLTFTTHGTIASGAFANVSGIEIITLADGGNSLTLTDALVSSANSATLRIEGGSGDNIIDGSGVTTAANKLIFVAKGGTYTLTGGAGNDQFQFNSTFFDHTDTVVGGGGKDTLNFTVARTLVASDFAHVSSVETLTLANGANKITLTDAMVASADSATMRVNGGTGKDTIDASAVATGRHVSISGGGGADVMTAGADIDRFFYAAASESTSTGYDTINGMNLNKDGFHTGIAVSGTSMVSGALHSGANFDSEFASDIGTVAAHSGVLLTVSASGGAGDLGGSTFVFVDLDGSGHYEAGHDLVIRLVSFTGTFGTGDFV